MSPKSRSLFVDTGPCYARYVARDQYHQEAWNLWQKIRDGGWRCLTSNLVIAELITLLVYRFGTREALIAAREIYNSAALEICRVTLENELRGLEFLEKFSDQKLSMTDATSFAVMEANDLRTAFTFDGHFTIAGYEKFS